MTAVFNRIKAKWRAFLNMQDAVEFWKGYDYAAGILLSAEDSPTSLLDMVAPYPDTPYVKGVTAAVKAYNQLLEEVAP